MVPVLVLLGILSAPATAADPEPPGQEVGEEMIVRADQELALARQRLEQAILDQGFRRSVRHGDRTVFPRPAPWKTKVVLYDDGLVELRTPGLVPMAGAPWWIRDDEGRIEAAGVDLGGVASGRRTRANVEGRLLDETEPFLAAWRDALWARHLAERRLVRREETRAAWFDGRTPDGRVLAGPAERRAWLLEQWLHTADSPAGEAMRADLEVFFADVVQRSATPFTADELTQANAQREFGPALRLPAS